MDTAAAPTITMKRALTRRLFDCCRKRIMGGCSTLLSTQNYKRWKTGIRAAEARKDRLGGRFAVNLPPIAEANEKQSWHWRREVPDSVKTSLKSDPGRYTQCHAMRGGHPLV